MRAPQLVPMPGLPARVTIHEVGPRDGLQNESTIVPVEVKASRLIFISGQTALDSDGNLVGKNDFAAQVAQVFRNTGEFFKGRIPQVPEYAEVCRAAAEKNYAWLDGELANRRFIAGDRFTIADITALCGVDFGRVSKIRIQPEQKNLARWREEVSARPSAKA